MKGLLRKDLYMIWKYCRSFLVIILLFFGLSVFLNESNMFLRFYPAVMVGMIPVTIVAYDERCKWSVYSESLPLSRAQAVSCKYLLSLIGTGAILLLSSLSQIMLTFKTGKFNLNEYFEFLCLLTAVVLGFSSLILPFVFKFGSEKGRIANMILVGIGSALIAIFVINSKGTLSFLQIPYAVLALTCIALFAVSWLMSIKFYEKREL